MVSKRRAETAAVNGTNNYVNIPANNILLPTNNSNSVMYWGYWKKQGEADMVMGATGATAASVGLSSSNVGIGVIEAPSSIIKSLEPLSSTSGIGPVGSAGGQTTPSLIGSALIAALSAEMAGYKATKWADQTIINYFLTPGKPGYIKYPGLTKNQFIKAAKGILAPASLLKLRGGFGGGGLFSNLIDIIP